MLDCPWSRAKDLVRSGRVEVSGDRVRDPAHRLTEGDVVVVRQDAPRQRRGVLAKDRVAHLDAHVMVVRKPAATLTVPWDEDDKDTLVDQARAYLKRHAGRGKKGRAARDPFVGVVQRLDKDTTGLLVFARNMSAKRGLEAQLRAHTVHRRYLAVVHGAFAGERTFETHVLRDRGDGLRGSWGHFRRARGPVPRDAKRCVTHVRALEPLRGATLVECRLETGRQHQIRIHLSEAGHALVGEAVYIRDHQGPKIQAGRPMLHAAELGFVHPGEDREVRFSEPAPGDFTALLERLRSDGR